MTHSIDFKSEIEKSRKSYLEEWEYTSQLYHQNGYYSQLASKFNSYQNILEIGTGAGYSTFSLASRSKKLISIDENEYCINKTHDFLKEHNIESDKILRGEINVNNYNLSYTTSYHNNFKGQNDKIQCIESDVLNDSKINDYLLSLENFDIVTCWMMGAHGLILNHESQLLKGRSGINQEPHMVHDYKLDVLVKIAQLSQNLLTKNGILNITERVRLDFVDQYGADAIIQSYLDDISPCGFQLERFDIFPINTRSKMKMVTDSNILDSNIKMGLLDMSFKKNAKMA